MSKTVKLEGLPSGVGPITRRSLVEQVQAVLSRLILIEDLQEGQQLPSERQLAAALGVSHTVVREALGILAREGIITKRHGLGNFVASFPHDSLTPAVADVPQGSPDPADLHRARCAIECGAVYMAAEYATEEDIAILLKLARSANDSANQPGTPAAQNLRFHLALLQATHSKTLQGLRYVIVDSIRLTLWARPAALQRWMDPQSVQSHEAIVHALRERDGVKALSTMHHHLTWWEDSNGASQPLK